MWLAFLACAGLLLAILLNYHAYLDYKRYKATALRAYGDTSTTHRVLRLLCKIASVLILLAFIYTLFNSEWLIQESLALLAFALLLALFGFVPFSSALWTLDDKGIYIYRARRFIPWSQIIGTGTQSTRRKTYLTLQVKKDTGEAFKRVYYAVLIPSAEVEEVRHIIRDFLQALEKQRYYKNRQEEKKIELKDRKWY